MDCTKSTQRPHKKVLVLNLLYGARNLQGLQPLDPQYTTDQQQVRGFWPEYMPGGCVIHCV